MGGNSGGIQMGSSVSIRPGVSGGKMQSRSLSPSVSAEAESGDSESRLPSVATWAKTPALSPLYSRNGAPRIRLCVTLDRRSDE